MKLSQLPVFELKKKLGMYASQAISPVPTADGKAQIWSDLMKIFGVFI